MKRFETGKTYTIFDKNCGARFGGTVTKRTRCTVTFELSDVGRTWCQTNVVTLRAKDTDVFDSSDGQMCEDARGRSKSSRNAAFNRNLFTSTFYER